MRSGGIAARALPVALYGAQHPYGKPGTGTGNANNTFSQIDVGGPTMVRAAAKNHPSVAVVVSPDRYADVLDAWREYLARDNRGRGVVLLGHSQGTRMLRQLLRTAQRRKHIRLQVGGHQDRADGGVRHGFLRRRGRGIHQRAAKRPGGGDRTAVLHPAR